MGSIKFGFNFFCMLSNIGLCDQTKWNKPFPLKLFDNVMRLNCSFVLSFSWDIFWGIVTGRHQVCDSVFLYLLLSKKN